MVRSITGVSTAGPATIRNAPTRANPVSEAQCFMEFS